MLFSPLIRGLTIKGDMKITGYRFLRTFHDWGRPVGDVNGFIDPGISEVPIVILETDEGIEGIGMGSHHDLDRIFPALIVVSLLTPAAIGGLVTWSWTGALTGLFWGGLVRMALLHHVTWSVNSICHVVGARPFVAREADRATNFWPLAILSFGESWHNSHHADPTGARHGVLRGQLDPAARLIWIFEKLGWAWDVRWPDPVRLAAKRNVVH